MPARRLFHLLAVLWVVSLALSFWLGGRRPATETDPGEESATPIERPETKPILFPNPLPAEAPLRTEERRAELRKEAAELGPGEIRDALAKAGEPRDPASADRHRVMVERWAALDPRGALDYANGLTQPKLRYDSQAGVLEEWATSDPASAWSYAATNPEGLLSDEMHDHVLEGVGQSNAATALRFARDHEEALLERPGAIENLVAELYLNGSATEVATQIEQVPAGALRNESSSALVGEWARYDPEAAKVWIEGQETGRSLPPEATAEAYRLLAKGWGRVDPHQAIQWAESLPSDQPSDTYMKEIFSTWLRIDEYNAAAWLVDRESSPQDDKLVEQYIRTVVDRNPAESMHWAESIADPKRRAMMKRRVGYTWEDLDPEGWKAYQSNNPDPGTE